jgi:hypothetical protein
MVHLTFVTEGIFFDHAVCSSCVIHVTSSNKPWGRNGLQLAGTRSSSTSIQILKLAVDIIIAKTNGTTCDKPDLEVRSLIRKVGLSKTTAVLFSQSSVSLSNHWLFRMPAL